MKYVLVDHSKLGRYSGFAEISENYGKYLAEMNIPDIHFVYMVPRRFFGHFGDNVNYISFENPMEDLRKLGVKIDLWHSTDQLFKFRLHQKGMKQLLTVHDLINFQKKKGIHKIKHLLKFRWRVTHSHCISVISDYVKKELHSYGIARNLPVVEIPNAVRELENDPRVKPSFVGENDKFFFAIGQVCPRKNFESIVAMMREFPEYKLFICGVCDSRYAREFKSALADSPESDRIVMTGGVSDEEKNWMYAHCEAFLMPSLMEGFGLPVVEAMRFGKPVFCANATSLPEVGDKYAYYWNDFTPEAMAKVVREGLASFSYETDGLAEMEYSKKYSYQQFTRMYVELYRKILRAGETSVDISLKSILQAPLVAESLLSPSVSE